MNIGLLFGAALDGGEEILSICGEDSFMGDDTELFLFFSFLIFAFTAVVVVVVGIDVVAVDFCKSVFKNCVTSSIFLKLIFCLSKYKLLKIS
jgi:hypothetical protein